MDLTITEVASRLDITRRAALFLAEDGSIGGRRLVNGAWLIDSDSVAEWERIGQRGRGRPLNAPTAWGILWELSGLEASWLPKTTRFRLRDRVERYDAQGLARAVAKRTTVHRYRSANAERAAVGLIATGRAAADLLESDLIGDRGRVSGYVRKGTVGQWADKHFMLADRTGQDLLYDNTLPIPWDADVMPLAVVAADLARSADTRERSTGLAALDNMRSTWLGAR